MIKVGITGGIGSGKSIVCKVFRCLGVPVYDADSRAKFLMTYDKELGKKIVKAFGPSSFTDGRIDTVFLAKIVFHEEEARKKINALVHPRVALDYENWLKKYSNAKYTLKESALMVETGAYKHLDKLITVAAQEALRIQRVIERDSRSITRIKAIIAKQAPEKEKQALADFIIHNDEQMVLPQCLKIHQQLIA